MGSAVKCEEAVNDLPVTWTAVEDLESWRTNVKIYLTGMVVTISWTPTRD